MSPRQVSKLTLEHILLAFLDQKPKHGYELHQELREASGISQIWYVKQALLYAILEKLEQRGYLTSQVVQGKSYPPRKYFHLTEIGKSSLQEWLKTPARRARDLRQEFLAKLIIARRYGESNVMELIHIQKQICRVWLSELQANVPSPDEEHLDDWMVYSFRINRVEGVLRWLQVLEEEVGLVFQGSDIDS